jgi:hypothetical protein
MLFLGLLRRVQRHPGIAEIGAGIIPVGIQEQIVKLARQIVVMRRIAARPRRRVELIQPPLEPAQRLQRAPIPRLSVGRDIPDREAEKAVDVVILDGQPAVHVPLADRHVRRKDDAARQGRVMQGDRCGRSRAVAIAPHMPVGERDLQITVAYEMLQKRVEYPDPHDSSPFFRARIRHDTL